MRAWLNDEKNKDATPAEARKYLNSLTGWDSSTKAAREMEKIDSGENTNVKRSLQGGWQS